MRVRMLGEFGYSRTRALPPSHVSANAGKEQRVFRARRHFTSLLRTPAARPWAASAAGQPKTRLAQLVPGSSPPQPLLERSSSRKNARDEELRSGLRGCVQHLCVAPLRRRYHSSSAGDAACQVPAIGKPSDSRPPRKRYHASTTRNLRRVAY
jgi:hypothetical protein